MTLTTRVSPRERGALLPQNALTALIRQTARTHPVLSREDEIAMVRKAQQGDQKAREYLVLSNLRLIAWAARPYRMQSHDIEDIVLEGSTGIYDAIERYDPALGTTFASYAVVWIRQKILALRKGGDGVVRMPHGVAQYLDRVRTTHAKLTTQLGREPTIPEIAKQIPGAAPSIIRQCLRIENWGFDSMDAELHDDGTATLHDVFSDTSLLRPDQALDAEDAAKELRADLRELREALDNSGYVTDRAKTIFVAFYDLDGGFERKRLQEVANEFGITRERVRQIIEQTWRRLERRQIRLTQDRMRHILETIQDLEDLTHRKFVL